MQDITATPTARPPVGIVYDSDFGQTIDTVLALALLYGFDCKEESRVVGVSVNKSNLKSAALADIVAQFYLRPTPIGMADNGKPVADTPAITGPLDLKNTDGTPVFAQSVHKLNDTAEPAAQIRNAFTAQHDQNCIVVLAGPPVNLLSVLALNGAKDLIARKVKMLVWASDSYPERLPEPAAKFLAEWPTPIVAAGRDAGESPRYPGVSIDHDFASTPPNPIAAAYRAGGAMPYDAPALALAAALYAVRPQEGYFRVSEPGSIEVSPKGQTRFRTSPDGKNRYLIPDPAQAARIAKVYSEVISAKPVPRRRPRLPA